MKINLHTHSTWCDGKSTTEEMVLAAIEHGFDVLGFSGHCMFPFSSSWHIPVNNIPGYCEEVKDLKKKYKNQLNIQLGFEADYIPNFTTPDKNDLYKEFAPDYLIGSIHYIVKEDGNFTVDDSLDNVRQNILKFYAPKDTNDLLKVDYKAYIHDYFETERQMLSKGNFDIIGHPDLIRMRNTVLHLFDESDSFYKEEVKLTAKAIAKAGVIAEINTGAIARGNMDDVYPSEYFLNLLFENGVPVAINSDAHQAQKLDAAFDRAAAQAKKIGYTELVYPIDGKMVSIKI